MVNNPKVIRGWCMYDWANSVYNLNITSSIFPAYYQAVTKNPENGDRISILGYEIVNTVAYSYAISFAFLCVVVIGPLLGGVADYFGRKKFFMQIFSTLGSLACLSLYFFTKENPSWGLAMLILATIGYAGSLVFYNAFLPEITTPETSDKVSAKGFSYGYVGSVVLLAVNLVMVLMPHHLGFEDSGSATRFTFLTVGCWWFLFAQYSLSLLPESKKPQKKDTHYISAGYKELVKVYSEIKLIPRLKKFLFAFFLYSMGAQTVMYVATLFGEKEFKLDTGQLITVVLILQLIAILGANGAAKVSSKKGNLFTLSIICAIWTVICVFAYFMQNAIHFYILAVFVGLVMGAIQALSRSTYSKMIPVKSQDHASFFSFYEATEKLAIVFGTFSYGLIISITGSMRNSIIGLALFFIAGWYLLLLIPKTNTYENSTLD